MMYYLKATLIAKYVAEEPLTPDQKSYNKKTNKKIVSNF